MKKLLTLILLMWSLVGFTQNACINDIGKSLKEIQSRDQSFLYSEEDNCGYYTQGEYLIIVIFDEKLECVSSGFKCPKIDADIEGSILTNNYWETLKKDEYGKLLSDGFKFCTIVKDKLSESWLVFYF